MVNATVIPDRLEIVVLALRNSQESGVSVRRNMNTSMNMNMEEHTDVILIHPPMPHLQIVVLNDEVHELVEETPALAPGQAVDALDVRADGEDALPARDGVGAHDGVHGGEVGACVLRRAARARVDGEAVSGGRFVEFRLRVGGA